MDGEEEEGTSPKVGIESDVVEGPDVSPEWIKVEGGKEGDIDRGVEERANMDGT